MILQDSTNLGKSHAEGELPQTPHTTHYTEADTRAGGSKHPMDERDFTTQCDTARQTCAGEVSSTVRKKPSSLNCTRLRTTAQ